MPRPGGSARVWATTDQLDDAIRETVAALQTARRTDLNRHLREAQAAADRRPCGPTPAIVLVSGDR